MPEYYKDLEVPLTAWQNAQLVITHDSRGTGETQTILWHGPGQGIGENFSGGGQTVLELLNRADADGWELADREVRQVHGEGDHYADASWNRTTYTFKCLVPE